MGGLTRTLSIPTNSSGGTIDVQLQEPNLTAENLGLKTWGSSYILASRLYRIDIACMALRDAAASTTDPGIKVLELGAGTGLVGLAAAAIWRTDVVLSDLGPIVPGLAINIASNTHLLSICGGSASCGELDWAKPAKLVLQSPGLGRQRHSLDAERNKALIILAADTVYSEEHPAMLSSAITTWLRHSPDARAIITYPLRVAYLDEIRELWELMEQGGLEATEEGKEVGSDDWDDEVLHEWSIWRWRRDDGNFSS